MVEDGLYDGKGHVSGQVCIQLSQESVCFDTGDHRAVSRLATAALHADIPLT